MAKYILCEGYYMMPSDAGGRKEYYITGEEIAALYGVPLEKCRIMRLIGPLQKDNRRWEKAKALYPKAIFLIARSDGNYTIPKRFKSWK